MAKIESWFDCDLKKPVQVQVLNGNVFSLDNNGSRIGVKFYDNGQKTTVTGSVSGRFILANGQTIDAITGTLATVNGQSVAYLDVPQSVLHVPGPLKITIQLTDSSVVTTVAAILATVYQTKTDDEIVPSQQVIDDWNAAITQAIGTQNTAIAAQNTQISDLKSALQDNTDTLYESVLEGSALTFTLQSANRAVNQAGSFVVAEGYNVYNARVDSLTGKRVYIDVTTNGQYAKAFYYKSVGITNGFIGFAHDYEEIPSQAFYIGITSQSTETDHVYIVNSKIPAIQGQITAIDTQISKIPAIQGQITTIDNQIKDITGAIEQIKGISQYIKTSGTIVNGSNGSYIPSTSANPVAIKFNVTPGVTFSITHREVEYEGGRGAAFYDENGNFIPGSGTEYVIGTTTYNFTAPEKAATFAYTAFYNGNRHTLSVIGSQNELYPIINSILKNVATNGSNIEKYDSAIKKTEDNLYNIEIEGHRNKTVNTGTVTSNKVMGMVASTQIPYESSLEGWEYKTASCIPGKTYMLSGKAGTYIPLYWIFDADGNGLAHGDVTQSGTQSQTATIQAPANANTIVVNGTANNTVIIAEIMQFVKDGVGKATTEANTFLVGTGKMKTQVHLYKSSNGAFRYANIYYNDAAFKGAGDDITPINATGAGYIGANHGYNFAYVATKTDHGLTASDIGKTYTTDGNVWILIQVNSTSQFTVVCKDDSKWYGMKTATPPATFNFGSDITPTSISSVSQLYPSIKNISVEIVENDEKSFVVAESYDIINPKTGIAEIISNVGDNDNQSFATFADIIATVRNVYSFSPESACVITQNLKMIDTDVVLSFYGGTQSGRFGDTDYFAVPLTSYAGFSASGTETYFGSNTWDDSSIPPIIYCQMDNSGVSATKMFVQGIVMEDRAQYINNGGAGFIASTRKMYPYAIQPRPSEPIETTYNLSSFRIPMYEYDMDSIIKFAGFCKVGKNVYFFCYNNTFASSTIKVSKDLMGKTIETVISRNASCKNTLVSTGIDVSFTGEGYLLLKLTD